MRVGNDRQRMLSRRSVRKQTEGVLGIVQEMGGQCPLMFLRVSLITRGLDCVFAWEVRRKYGVCKGNRRTAVDLLSIEGMEMEKRGNQDPRHHPRQKHKAEGRRVDQFVHRFTQRFGHAISSEILSQAPAEIPRTARCRNDPANHS